jgi:hypothetical protein
LEEEHEQQILSFEQFWQEKFEQYDAEATTIRDRFLERKQEEREAYIEELQTQFRKNGKMSAKYLNLKFKMDQLSKAQRFEEAAEIKGQLEEEYIRCMQKLEKDLNEKLEKLLIAFDKKQENELRNLEKKMIANRNDLMNTKNKDLDNLVKRYNAQRTAFNNKCNIERAQKVVFLQAFDPSKNAKASKIYVKSLEFEVNGVEGQNE